MKVHGTLIMALGLALGCDAVTSGTVRTHAREDARTYVRTIHPAWTTPVVDCQGVDSDGDGYVRCTVGDGANATEAIECRTSVLFDYQRGCAPMRTPQGRAR
jgi:hypothetical protein